MRFQITIVLCLALGLLICSCSPVTKSVDAIVGANVSNPVDLIKTTAAYSRQVDTIMNETLDDFSVDVPLMQTVSETPDGILVPDKVQADMDETVLFNITVQNRLETAQNYTLSLGPHQNIYAYPREFSIKAVHVKTLQLRVRVNTSEILRVTITDSEESYQKEIPIELNR